MPSMPTSEPDPRLDRLIATATGRWDAVPDALRDELAALFAPALAAADAAEPETLLVANPVTRPQRLRLGVVATDRDLDRMYRMEWCELGVTARGELILVYRRRNGDHYATVYDAGVTLPETLVIQLPPALAEALLDA